MDACDSSRFCPRGKDAGAREENAWAVGRELEFAASTKNPEGGFWDSEKFWEWDPN